MSALCSNGTRPLNELERWLALACECQRKNKATTNEWYRERLESFTTHIGGLRVSSLKPGHVTAWIAKRYPNTKNGSTIHGAMRSVQRVFNWARKEGMLKVSPLEGLEKPQPTSRDVEAAENPPEILPRI